LPAVTLLAGRVRAAGPVLRVRCFCGAWSPAGIVCVMPQACGETPLTRHRRTPNCG
jgi:hypothetical protein